MALSVPEKLKGKVFIRESPIAPAAAAINEGHDPPNRRGGFKFEVQRVDDDA
jgi:hypothetical protein